MREDHLREVLVPVLDQFALELEAVEIIPAGKRSLLRIVVDGDGPQGRGPLLDDIASATRAISDVLDVDTSLGHNPYTLEVSSRGVSRPLELPRHWRRNRDRLVSVTLADGESVTGRIGSSDDTAVTLSIEGTERVLAYADIAKALVQVELNRKPTPDEWADDEVAPHDAEDGDDDGDGEDDGADAEDDEEN